jgi:hypothetical protein
LNDAIDILDQRRFDRKPKNKHKKKGGRDGADDGTNTVPPGDTSFAQSGRSKPWCYKCGEEGHTCNKCTKSIPRDQWATERGRTLLQRDSATSVVVYNDDQSYVSAVTTNTANTAAQASTGPRRSGHQGFQFQSQTTTAARPTLRSVSMKQVVRHKGRGSRFGRKPIIDLKKVLVLDTGSTLHSIANSDFVKGIQVSPTKMVMTTNAGQKELHLLAKIPGINQEVWYDPDQITNILSFGVLVDQGIRITYDSSVEDAFFVHFPNQVFKFVRKAGIYVREPNEAWVNYVRQQKGLNDCPEDPANNSNPGLAQIKACPE